MFPQIQITQVPLVSSSETGKDAKELHTMWGKISRRGQFIERTSAKVQN